MIRPIEPADIRPLMRLVESAWRVHLRLSPAELKVRLKKLPAFLAEDRVGVRGFAVLEPLPSGLGMLVAAGLRDTWAVKPYLDLFLPKLTQTGRNHQLHALVHIGNAEWLNEGLQARGFAIKEWIVAFERTDPSPPPEPVQISAELRSAHISDLPALLALDNVTFEHLWHKSGGTFSEALARAASFTVALVDDQIVAYQWCELYGKHAHLTRLAVHPGFQGRGIGAQLLHRAIMDVLNMGANLITLNTQEKNQRSQTLYERFGFTNTRQRLPVLWLELPADSSGK
jgi:GNAT superfamily N-acetyltransferase